MLVKNLLGWITYGVFLGVFFCFGAKNLHFVHYNIFIIALIVLCSIVAVILWLIFRQGVDF